jgi:hypothetical protein
MYQRTLNCYCVKPDAVNPPKTLAAAAARSRWNGCGSYWRATAMIFSALTTYAPCSNDSPTSKSSKYFTARSSRTRGTVVRPTGSCDRHAPHAPGWACLRIRCGDRARANHSSVYYCQSRSIGAAARRSPNEATVVPAYRTSPKWKLSPNRDCRWRRPAKSLR